MKRPSAASLKKVTAANLTALGPERLAEILLAVADTRPDVKRRLRMELAAGQGVDHLAQEVDRRLTTLEAGRSKVSWRTRANFVRDLDALRSLIAERMTDLDTDVALSRMWRFLALARPLGARVRDKDGSLAAVFDKAAADLGDLLKGRDTPSAASALVDALTTSPAQWGVWLPAVLEKTAPGLAARALTLLQARPGAVLGWSPLIRLLADTTGDVDAYAATFSKDAAAVPKISAEIARRQLSAGRTAEAGRTLARARDHRDGPDFDWESVWIEWLEASGDPGGAQAARWASFERTLSPERVRAFTQRLPDFEDVEAEHRAFAVAAGHPNFRRGLAFLMDWPALAEAAQMILGRPDDVNALPDEAELWAARLRPRQPQAALLLLRKTAAAAFRRRDLATCDRLTAEADAIGG